MGLDNPLHILIVLVVLLLLFGAKRLPEMGRGIGAGIRGFKDGLTAKDEPEQSEPPAPQLSAPVAAEAATGSEAKTDSEPLHAA